MIKRDAIKKLLLYGASSALALGVDFGLLLWLHKVDGVDYLLAAAIGFSCGCIVTYICSRLFVFDNNSNRRDAITFVLFVLVGVLGLGLNHIVLYLGVDVFEITLVFAKCISAGLVFWFNFLLRGMFVFKDPDLCKTHP